MPQTGTYGMLSPYEMQCASRQITSSPRDALELEQESRLPDPGLPGDHHDLAPSGQGLAPEAFEDSMSRSRPTNGLSPRATDASMRDGRRARRPPSYTWTGSDFALHVPAGRGPRQSM